MKKTILYRLFKVGRVHPKKLMPALKKEGLVACDEGIAGRIYLENYSAPGKRSRKKLIWFSGFVVVTKVRLIAFAYWKPLINVKFADERFGAMRAELDGPDRISFRFEASAFREDASGEILVRFRTPKAREILEAISSVSETAGSRKTR